MTIDSFAKATVRLLISPITGVIAGYKEADSRPKAANWKQFILNDIHDYFLPFTGAIKGVKKAICRRGDVA